MSPSSELSDSGDDLSDSDDRPNRGPKVLLDAGTALLGSVGGALLGAVRETPRTRIAVRGRGEDLLFVLGWGNEPEHEHVSWLIDRLVDAGYRVHAVQLPTNGWNFASQFVAPVRAYVEERDFEVALSHSTGGLAAAHLDAGLRHVFLSPWWGTEPRGGVESLVAPYVLKVPTVRPLVPVRYDPAAVGDLKTDANATGAPDAISPAFLRTVVDAQESLPPFDPADVVFCSLSDAVVSVRAIGRRTPAANLRPYDGGHEFFASSSREKVLPDVLATLDRGPDAIR